jgi:hypothetical protein
MNHGPARGATAQVSLGDWVPGSRVLVQELNAASRDTANSFERPDAMSVAEASMDNPGGNSQHRFPERLVVSPFAPAPSGGRRP